MVSKYFGVLCKHCDRFILKGAYPAQHPEQVQRVSLSPHNIECPACGNVSTYFESDVAHSFFLDGRNAFYPDRTLQKS